MSFSVKIFFLSGREDKEYSSLFRSRSRFSNRKRCEMMLFECCSRNTGVVKVAIDMHRFIQASLRVLHFLEVLGSCSVSPLDPVA